MGFVQQLPSAVPRVENFEALIAYFEPRCLERMDAGLRGYSEAIGQRNLDTLWPLPSLQTGRWKARSGL